MKDLRIVTLAVVVLLMETLYPSDAAMTMKQINESMETMRKACAPKFDLPEATLNELKKGNFRPDADKELKCYAKCIAQMAGTLTKKGEISFSKTSAQIEALLPAELKAGAKEALKACKDVHATRVFLSYCTVEISNAALGATVRVDVNISGANADKGECAFVNKHFDRRIIVNISSITQINTAKS